MIKVIYFGDVYSASGELLEEAWSDYEVFNTQEQAEVFISRHPEGTTFEGWEDGAWLEITDIYLAEN